MNSQNLSEYEYLWDGSDSGWVLVENSESESGYTIYNEVKHIMLHIDITDLKSRICKELLDSGAKVLKDMPEGEAEVIETGESVEGLFKKV